jgi:transposase
MPLLTPFKLLCAPASHFGPFARAVRRTPNTLAGSASHITHILELQRTGVTNQIRGFLLERGVTVRQGLMPFRKALPDILSSKSDALSPRMINLISELIQDWRRLDERIAAVSSEIEAMAKQDESCQQGPSKRAP